MVLLLLYGLLLCSLGNDLAQSQQSDGVGQNHQVVEEVGQFPNQVILQQSAQEDESDGNYRVDNGSGLVLLAQVFHIDLAEEVPAQNGGECEEQQADCNEDVTEASAENRTNCIALVLETTADAPEIAAV